LDLLATPYSDYFPNLPMPLDRSRHVGRTVQLFLAIRKKIPKAVGNSSALNQRHLKILQPIYFAY
jgi:hypothetical protein